MWQETVSLRMDRSNLKGFISREMSLMNARQIQSMHAHMCVCVCEIPKSLLQICKTQNVRFPW